MFVSVKPKKMGRIVEQKKLDLVVQDAAFVSPRIDITSEVINALNAR